MKNFKYLLSVFLLVAVMILSCQEEERTPILDDGNPPGPVTSTLVEAIPGGAKISYTLPDNPNLLYVKAVYDRNGEEVIAKASYYKNFIIVEGLGDTQSRKVTLYAVSRSEKVSSPVEVTITPLAPPIHKVLASLDIEESFGGMNIYFENEASTTARPSNIIIYTLGWNSVLNEWEEVNSFYTALAFGKFSIRGLPPVKRKFAFVVKDTYENRTDTLEKELTPVYEEELDYSKIVDRRTSGAKPIPQIAPLDASGKVGVVGNLGSWPFSNMFNDVMNTNAGFHTNERQPQPMWIPMELVSPSSGKKVKLSRYKFWQRLGYEFNHGTPHEWEIWGTDNPDDVNSWVLLDHQVMVKPSGLPLGQLTNDDRAASAAGMEYEIPIDKPAVKWIAIKHIDNWGGIEGATGFFMISEMKMWGQYQ